MSQGNHVHNVCHCHSLISDISNADPNPPMRICYHIGASPCAVSACVVMGLHGLRGNRTMFIFYGTYSKTPYPCLVQECGISSANALEIPQSYTKLICYIPLWRQSSALTSILHSPLMTYDHIGASVCSVIVAVRGLSGVVIGFSWAWFASFDRGKRFDLGCCVNNESGPNLFLWIRLDITKIFSCLTCIIMHRVIR